MSQSSDLNVLNQFPKRKYLPIEKIRLAKFEKKIVNLYKQEKLRDNKRRKRKHDSEGSLNESSETIEETSQSTDTISTSTNDKGTSSSVGKENVKDEFFEQMETELKRQKRLKYKMKKRKIAELQHSDENKTDSLDPEPNETKQNDTTKPSQQTTTATTTTTTTTTTTILSSSSDKRRTSRENFSLKSKKPDPFKTSKEQFISHVQEQLKRQQEIQKKRNLMKQQKKIRHKKTQKAMQRSRKGQPIMKNYIENLLSKIEQENSTIKKESKSQNSSEFCEVSEQK